MPVGSNISEHDSESAAVDGNTNFYVADAGHATLYKEICANGTWT
ncbi:MAG: hypothetical protein ACP5M4_13460 [Acidobacteriaceae bacterium]